MPDNRVYQVLSDKLGYLWIATSKGVLRYNGYEFKLFNILSGMTNEEIWSMVQDRGGRIWLANISDEIGYIYNDKYRQPVFKGNNNVIYPKDLMPFGDGVIFQSSFVGGNKNTICLGNKDSVWKLAMEDSVFCRQGERHGEQKDFILLASDNTDRIKVLHNDYVYDVTLSKNRMEARRLFPLKRELLHDEQTNTQLLRNNHFAINRHLILYSRSEPSTRFSTIDLSNGKTRAVDIGDLGYKENILYIHWDMYDGRKAASNDVFYVVTSRHILQFSSTDTIRFDVAHPLTDFILEPRLDGGKLLSVYKDPFWGNCIGSEGNGLFVNYNTPNKFKPANGLGLDSCNYVGCYNDSLCFWINYVTSSLVVVDKKDHISRYKYPNKGRIDNVAYYSGDSFLVSGVHTYWFIRHSGKLVPIKPEVLGDNIFCIISNNPNELFIVSKYGFYRANKEGGAWSKTFLARDRYRHLVYDACRRTYWAYNAEKIFVYGQDTAYETGKQKLPQFGMHQQLEKIVIDEKFGNIFFSGYNTISMYDYERRKSKQLLKQFNLRETSIFCYKDYFIVIGHFGVIVCRILGPQLLSKPFVYPNLKDINYKFVYNYQVLNGKIMMVTDKGVYNLPLPSDAEISGNAVNAPVYPCNLVVNYRDSLFNVNMGDTVIIDQKHPRLQFDVINPFGNGRVKYSYKLQSDSSWHELYANELNLPALSPDGYYRLSIVASDNAWKSDEMFMQLYMQPYWWQTHSGRHLTWLGSSLLVFLILSSSVLITRRQVLRVARKKSMRMELELKSIYAQINPHFIFNTLNSALFLIKTKQLDHAYQHIYKFSHLLRSYIKSSRNRFIRLSDEIDNLTAYIDLQRARFENKFDYEITVKEPLDPSVEIPSLLLQPLVENAITHGLLNKDEKGSLKITFSGDASDNSITCVIDDDGIGRQRALRLSDPRKEGHYGDVLIQDLTSIFNVYEQIKISVDYADKEEPLCGTTVKIVIKNLRQ